MCGIAGGFIFDTRFEFSESVTQGFLAPLSHRGPDAEKQIILRNATSMLWLGHRRLSIIDLSTRADQPMASESGRTMIVFNGEIYNYRELRVELIQRGCRFQTNSDTEVILNAYETWGMTVTARKLDGMFAFALFDLQSEQLFLVRDRFGKKPLYYTVAGSDKAVFFSSDIRSFNSLDLRKSVDLHALGYFFSELSTPQTDTIWKEIKKVRPATCIRISRNGQQQVEQYWDLTYSNDCRLSFDDVVAQCEWLLEKAVRKRLVADVHVSAFLSGGIDSSLVVAKMAHQLGRQTKTYSVGFKDEAFNELPFARMVAEKFETDHTELIVDETAFNNVNELISEYGEPFADSSMIPTYLMCKEISRVEKVVLGGDGGDELFGGYPSYYFAHKLDKVSKLRVLYPLAALLNKAHSSYRTNYLAELLRQSTRPAHLLLNRNIGFSAHQLKRLYSNDIFYDAATHEHSAIWKEFARTDCSVLNLMASSLHTRLLNDYLVKIDRASMFASLEVRSPFLDKDLAEFAATLTPRQLFNQAGPKAILKGIARKFFPDDFVDRQKMGFSIPLGKWFAKSFSNNLSEVLLGGRQALIDFNYQFIEEILREHNTGAADHSHRIWSLYVFHLWARNQ